MRNLKGRIIASKVAAKETWATDVRLPVMLPARVVHPNTLGSTLVSAGPVGKTRFPNAQVVVKGNLVEVVAPTEWEAIEAADHVAKGTKWTEWKSLPDSRTVHEHLRAKSDWSGTQVATGRTNKGDVGPALSSAGKNLSATYRLSYMKHAPIGPTMAVAEVK